MPTSSAAAGREPLIEHVTPADGNVFRDIGFLEARAQNLLARSELMLRLEQVIRRRRLTQARAAKLLGVTQPRISDLMRGKIDRFSIDTLIQLLARAGMNVSITVAPRAA